MFFRLLYTVAISVGVMFAAVGVVVVPVLTPVILTFGMAVAVVVGRNVSATDPGERGALTRDRGRTGVLAGSATAAGCLVLTGLVVVLGSATGLVILMLLVAAAPVTWSRWPQWSRSWRHLHDADDTGSHRRPEPVAVARPPAVAAAVPALTVEQLSVLQLCLAWHRSYFTLLDTPAGPARYQVVCVREVLLDELERRWLEGGARAGSNPGRYLGTGR